jgi:23S rRNA pseudouridine955/2504/2580 synthase
VLLIAKKRSALVELHRMLREGEIEKTYLAAVKGSWRGGAREIREPLHKYVTAGGERRVSVRAGGMQAATRVRPLASAADVSLLELRLLTGRTHQLRVHLAYAGHPILGDDKYGDFELNRALAKQGVKRTLLHARRVRLAHPLTRERLTLEASLPPDLAAFVRAHFPDHAA